jgi:hypothetical protein
MVEILSPSDYTTINPSYANGRGYYTTSTYVAQLLQIPDFSATTAPTAEEIGLYIRRAEDFIDNYTHMSFRPILYEGEYHDFTVNTGHYPLFPYRDYIGFIQLDQHHIRKLISLEVWHGSSWTNIASASTTVTFTDTENITNVQVILPTQANSSAGLTFTMVPGTSTSTFNCNFGKEVAAMELAYLINEQLPAKTLDITAQTAAKTKTDTTAARNISDFFYASVDEENPTVVRISSLLPFEGGQSCTAASSGSGISATASFSDAENRGRTDDFWTIGPEGRIFFRKRWPYSTKNSIKATYLAGASRVPAIIHDAATKLSACEVLRSDDASVLIPDTDAGIDIKTKYDTMRKETLDMLDMKKRQIVFIE